MSQSARASVFDDEDMDRPMATPMAVGLSRDVLIDESAESDSPVSGRPASGSTDFYQPPPSPAYSPAAAAARNAPIPDRALAVPVTDSPYSSEDWRSTVRGSNLVAVEASGTVYRDVAAGEEDDDEGPISMGQRILRISVILALIAALVFGFLYAPAISQWFNS
jgi:hypothetical protein